MRRVLALLALGMATAGMAAQAAAPTGSIDDVIAAEMPVSGAPGLR